MLFEWGNHVWLFEWLNLWFLVLSLTKNSKNTTKKGNFLTAHIDEKPLGFYRYPIFGRNHMGIEPFLNWDMTKTNDSKWTGWSPGALWHLHGMDAHRCPGAPPLAPPMVWGGTNPGALGTFCKFWPRSALDSTLLAICNWRIRLDSSRNQCFSTSPSEIGAGSSFWIWNRTMILKWFL